MPKLNVLIAGSTGYIGIQLIKLLIKHKNINIRYLCGNSSIGKQISYFDKSLIKIKLPKIIKFNNKLLVFFSGGTLNLVGDARNPWVVLHLPGRSINNKQVT